MAANIRLTDKVSNVNEEDELRKRGYIVGVTLGEGSYAKVKSAYYEKTDKKVALKIINRKKAPKDFQTRFLPRELDILRRIKHPNIILLIDIMHFNHKVLHNYIPKHRQLMQFVRDVTISGVHSDGDGWSRRLVGVYQAARSDTGRQGQEDVSAAR